MYCQRKRTYIVEVSSKIAYLQLKWYNGRTATCGGLLWSANFTLPRIFTFPSDRDRPCIGLGQGLGRGPTGHRPTWGQVLDIERQKNNHGGYREFRFTNLLDRVLKKQQNPHVGYFISQLFSKWPLSLEKISSKILDISNTKKSYKIWSKIYNIWTKFFEIWTDILEIMTVIFKI